MEYRDGVPSEHYQTRTVSREKVAEAMIGWMRRDPGWKDAFQWTNIGSMFGGDYQGDCDAPLMRQASGETLGDAPSAQRGK